MWNDAMLLLRARGVFAVESAVVPWARIAGLVVTAGLAYGLVMGSLGGNATGAVYSCVKLPMLLTFSLVVCLPNFYVMNAILGLRADFPAAEYWAADAWRRAPGSAEAAYNLGLALRWQGKYAACREPLTAAMRLQPAYRADCLAEIGAATAALGDPAAARPLLEEALRLKPGHEGATRYLKLVDQSLGAAAR